MADPNPPSRVETLLMTLAAAVVAEVGRRCAEYMMSKIFPEKDEADKAPVIH